MYPTIESTVSDIISTPWNITDGIKVPDDADFALKNGGKRVDATYVYADLAGSSKLAQTLTMDATAKIIKTYVNTAARILNFKDGAIRSFDGDRVMAIFMGADKEDRAVRAALAINWAVVEVIQPAIKKGWADGDDFYNIRHAVGVDTGEALIVKGGIRNNSDLISVGAAPNVAAKLSDIRTSQSTFITDRVFEKLSPNHRYFEDGRTEMFSRYSWRHDVGGQAHTVYGSSAWWAI